MLTEIFAWLRNWFPRSQLLGTFVIENGNLRLTYDDGAAFSNVPLVNGQYFRIINSAMNDGVYRYPTTNLTDETFSGAVWTMAVPPAVVAIIHDIKAWQDKYGGVDSTSMSPYTSESFGGYSYTKANGGDADGSAGASWQTVFGKRLSHWRKI